MTSISYLFEGSSISHRHIDKIRSKKTFEALRSTRFRASTGRVRISYVDGFDHPCFAYAIGRKVGGAVVRNRLRRRLRAIAEELAADIAPGAYVVSVSRDATSLSYGELKADVNAALLEIKQRIST